MSIVVIGVNHRTGPLAVLERVSLAAGAVPKAVHALASRDNVSEVVVVSTCNRTEVYAVAERFHGALSSRSRARETICAGRRSAARRSSSCRRARASSFGATRIGATASSATQKARRSRS